MIRTAYDAIIVGSGPNGFAAAITLQQQGLSTLLIEGASTVGGGMRTKELMMSGYRHDVCSAIHPMALASPFMQSIPLSAFGLTFKHAKYEAAHPLLHAQGAVLHRDLKLMLDELGEDSSFYQSLIQPLVDGWDELAKQILGPLRMPESPVSMARFGITAIQSASRVAEKFKSSKARALWAGMAAHGIQPLEKSTTAAVAMVLLAVGHKYGWAIPMGGSQSIASAMWRYYESIGGTIQTDYWVTDIGALPSHKCLLLDLTPNQIISLKGLNLSAGYTKQLQRYKQGMGVFKIDWALSDITPFTDKRAREASTVHLGNTFENIALGEKLTQQGQMYDKPYILFTQPSVYDPSRAPKDKHVGWAYCHVPNGSNLDYTSIIEKQMELYAPGFKDTIIDRHTFTAQQMEQYNPNYVGGDINGGLMDIFQLYTRPTLSLTPYRTSNKGVYICSSSTPPGGGVHGMCGYHAARTALKDIFQ